jgi:hypothetical protein
MSKIKPRTAPSRDPGTARRKVYAAILSMPAPWAPLKRTRPINVPKTIISNRQRAREANPKRLDFKYEFVIIDTYSFRMG